MPYENNGNLRTNPVEVEETVTIDSQEDWENNQEQNNVVIENGIVRLEESSEIPNIEGLHSWYDATKLTASDGDNLDSWADESGNNHWLTAGNAPEYISNGIDGNASVRFDGSESFLDNDFSTLSPPIQIFAIIQFNNINGYAWAIESNSNNERLASIGINNNGNWAIYGGNDELIDGPADTNPHVFSTLWTQTDIQRIDGSQIISGSGGNNNLPGLRIGSQPNDSSFAEIDVGEIILYEQDKSNAQSEIGNYLSEKWGITL